jgi:exosome complex exonuclease DIS3/RRP44
MNRRHRAAQLAGRASVQLHTLIFFSGDDQGEGGGVKEEDAYVLDVETSDNTEPSFSVMVPRYGIEGRVRLSHIATDDPCLVRDQESFSLHYKDTKSGNVQASVAVFDKVRVRIWVKKSRDHRELILDLLEPKVLAKPEVVSSSKSKTKKQKTN